MCRCGPRSAASSTPGPSTRGRPSGRELQDSLTARPAREFLDSLAVARSGERRDSAASTVPLFTGGRLLNEQRAARARADQSRARYESVVLTAFQEAGDALAGLRLTRDQLMAQHTQVQALGRALTLAQRRYESGVSSYLEVLDAQRGLYTAQLGLAQTERLYLSSTVRLYRAVGGGWSREPRR